MSRLRELRRERAMTQAQLARKAGIAPRTVGNAENGGPHATRVDVQRRLLRALGIPFERRRDVFSDPKG